MTEQEWLECNDPQPMLEVLQKSGASDRKLRLFAVACSRRVWDQIDALGRAAVDAAEDFADGLCSPDRMRAARLACQGAGDRAAWYAAATRPAVAARNAARSAQAGIANNTGPAAEAAELLAQAILLRDIFGDPRRPLSVDRAWRSPAVVNLAQTIYDDRAFDRTTALAGALEEAGCHHQEFLRHCRESGPHARGCWVLDLILEKA